MYKKLLNSNWTMRRTDSDESIPAQVPGSVYEDLLRNGKMDDPFGYGLSYTNFEIKVTDFSIGNDTVRVKASVRNAGEFLIILSSCGIITGIKKDTEPGEREASYEITFEQKTQNI